MKRNIIILIGIIISFNSVAQVLSVANLKWWNKEYLTVVNAGLIQSFKSVNKDRIITISEDETKIFQSFSDYKDFDPIAFCYNVDLGSSLLEVDGKSANGLKPTDFYKLVADGCHEFTFISPSKEIYTTTISNNNYQWITNSGVNFEKYDLHDINSSFYNVFKNQTNVDVLVDWEIDWGKIGTYDFLIVGNDPLLDKEILKEFEKNCLSPYMKRDTENPDVIISISRDAQKSITSTYVPPKTDYVKTGSTTRKIYNWIGMDPKYQTSDHITAIEHKGYIHNIVNSDLFLEIAMLDAHQLSSTTPPIIYKASKRLHLNDDVDVNSMLKKIACEFMHPFDYKRHINILHFNNEIPYAIRWGISVDGGANISNTSTFGLRVKYTYPIKQVNYEKKSVNKVEPGDIISNVKISTQYLPSTRVDVVKIRYIKPDGKKMKTELRYYAKRDKYGGIAINDMLFSTYSCGLVPCLITLEE